jgi:hypothetical protein
MLLNMEREVPKLWTLAQKAIYPVLRWRGDLDTLEIAHRDTGDPPLRPRVALPFPGELLIRIAYDFGSSTTQVTADLAETWGVPLDELYARALQNLRALERPRWVLRTPGLWMIESTVSYEESMLLRDDVLDMLDVRGDPLLLPSNRGVLLAAGSDDAAGIEAMLDAARAHQLNDPWPLSTQVLRRRSGGFEPAVLDGSAARKLAALRKIEIAGIYKDQKDGLEKWLARTGRDIFVATYVLVAKPNDGDDVSSYCTWTQGAHSWLPLTDLVALNRDLGKGEFETIFVTWGTLEEMAQPLLRRLEEEPPRFEVVDFPATDEWRRLKDAAVR